MNGFLDLALRFGGLGAGLFDLAGQAGILLSILGPLLITAIRYVWARKSTPLVAQTVALAVGLILCQFYLIPLHSAWNKHRILTGKEHVDFTASCDAYRPGSPRFIDHCVNSEVNLRGYPILMAHEEVISSLFYSVTNTLRDLRVIGAIAIIGTIVIAGAGNYVVKHIDAVRAAAVLRKNAGSVGT